MYDIEVIEGSNYAVISEGSPAYNFLKEMNSKLVMKKLASEPGEDIGLDIREVSGLCSKQGIKVQDLKRLQDVNLLDYKSDYTTKDGEFKRIQSYTFTEYGLEIMAYLRQEGGDVEIRLN